MNAIRHRREGRFDELNSVQDEEEDHSDLRIINHLTVLNRQTGDVPDPRSEHSLIYREKNALFLFGGLGAAQNPLNDFWMYRLDTNSWVRIGGDGSGFPSPRCWQTISLKCDGSKLYLFGGFDTSNDLNDLWRFSFDDNTWKLLAPNSALPQGRDRHAMVTYQKTLLVFGGYNGEYMNDMWRYSLEDNAWNQMETKAASSGGPPKRRSHGMTIIKNTIYMFGGANGDKTLADLWKFDIASSSWTELSSSNRPSRRSRMAFISDGQSNMFMFGGFDSANYRYDLWHFQEGAGWQQVDANGDIPVERSDFDVAFQRFQNPIDQGRVYLFGGFDGKTKYNDLYAYEISSQNWSVVFAGTTQNY